VLHLKLFNRCSLLSSSIFREINNIILFRHQKNIKSLRSHLRLIQTQEESLLTNFSNQLAMQGKEKTPPEILEKQKAEFLENLQKVRSKRKLYRGLLWDAVETRNRYIKSFEVQQNAEKEKEEQVNFGIGKKTKTLEVASSHQHNHSHSRCFFLVQREELTFTLSRCLLFKP
jgi:hypothetical protein